MPKSCRRVVTGLDAAGKSAVIMEGESENVVSLDAWPGLHVTTLWVTDEFPVVNRGDEDQGLRSAGHGPSENGTVFRYYQFPPDSNRPENPTALLGLEGATEEDLAIHPMMHATESIDYVVVVSGRISMVMGDGSEIDLGPGDCVVQRGTKHAWSNKGTEPACLFAACVAGATAE